ncbi:MAG: PadR family transcriptional regulator [Balneola sp.]|nr:MAG: PadR family transcriptional regulator [Balneola sp.]
MKETNLGEFQEVILLVILSQENRTYGAEIQRVLKEDLDRTISRGSLHTALTRLEQKGFITSEIGGATRERGGRRKKFFSVSNSGRASLIEAREIRERLWNKVPQVVLKGI